MDRMNLSNENGVDSEFLCTGCVKTYYEILCFYMPQNLQH